MDTSSTNLNHDPFLGHTIRNGNIILESFIGGGGMGRVYKGLDLTLDRHVAVKILHPEYMNHPNARKFIKKEALAASKLWHPNIIQIIELSEEPDSTLCLIMEYAPGLTLADIIERYFPLPTPRIIRILIQILTALQVAHSSGIIHRDLKPENIMLKDLPGQPDFVKILDFGVAKRMDTDNTGINEADLGTPHFMSPEQASGRPTDQRSDIYSVGVILYQIITRELPFNEGTLPVLSKVIAEEPIPPSKTLYGEWVDKNLEKICIKAMRKNPLARYQSAEEFLNSLQQLQKLYESKSIIKQTITGIKTATHQSEELPAHNNIHNQNINTNAAILAIQITPQNLSNLNEVIESARITFENLVTAAKGKIIGHTGMMTTALFGQNAPPTIAIAQAIKAIQNIIKHSDNLQLKFGLDYGNIAYPENNIANILGISLENAINAARNAKANTINGNEKFLKPLAPPNIIPLDNIITLTTENLNNISNPQSLLTTNLPIIGRDKEINSIKLALEKIENHSESIVLALTAKPGFGKSRLLTFIANTAQTLKINVIFTTPELYNDFYPALALKKLLLACMDLFQNQNFNTFAEKLKLSISTTNALCSLLSLQPAKYSRNDWTDELLVAWKELLSKLPKPLLILCDDFDKLDIVTFLVLDQLIANLPTATSAIITSDLNAPQLENFNEQFDQITLHNLQKDDINALLIENFPKLTQEQRDLAIELVQNSPENLNLLWQFLLDNSEQLTELPTTTSALQQIQFQQIPELARRVLASASLLGRSFSLEPLLHACPREWNFRQALRVLGNNKLIFTREDDEKVSLRLRSETLLNIAQSQLSSRAVVNLHQRFADYHAKIQNPSINDLYQNAKHLFASKNLTLAFAQLKLAIKKAYKIYGPLPTLQMIETFISFIQNTENITILTEDYFLVAHILILAQHEDEAYELLQSIIIEDEVENIKKNAILLDAAIKLSLSSKEELISQLYSLANKNCNDPVYQSFILTNLASLLEAENRLEEASKIALLAYQNIIDIKELTPCTMDFLKWRTPYTLATLYHKTARLEDSNKLFNDIIEKFPSPSTPRLFAFIGKARLVNDTNNLKSAIELLNNALNDAIYIADFRMQAKILADLASLHFATTPSTANEYFKSAFNICDTLDLKKLKSQLQVQYATCIAQNAKQKG